MTAVSVAVGKADKSFWTKLKESYVVFYLRSNRLHAFGVIYIILAIIIAAIGPMIVPYSPIKSMAGMHLLQPSTQFWFGTDVNGMDIFSRTIAAFRTDLLIGFSGALLSMFIGAPVGIFTGYFDGRGGVFGFITMLIMRFEDVIQAFPIHVLGLLMVAAFGPRPINVVLAIIIVNHVTNVRLARAEVLSLRDKQFTEAARASGNSDLRIAFGHLMPNSLTQVIALISMVTGYGIMLTAGLSFIGAGVRAPTPEWGSMISIGAPSIVTGQWWPAFFPGLFMAVTIFSFSMAGEALTALFDPLNRLRLGYRR